MSPTSAPLPANEARRLEALHAFEIMDTPPEEMFQELVEIASEVCGTQVAMINLVDAERQWTKAKVGIDIENLPREQAFCAHTIVEDGMMIVQDAQQDPRFQDNPLVTGSPNIRFYAGAQLRTSQGDDLGAICVIDERPRQLDAAQLRILRQLARQATRLIEYRSTAKRLADALQKVKTLDALLPMCAWCGRVREDDEYWVKVQDYLKDRGGTRVSHSVCPDCETTGGL